MRRAKVVLLFFLIILFSSVALLNEAERAEFVSYVDYVGTDESQLCATAVEKTGEMYRLKIYHWQGDELISEQILAESPNRFYQPELLKSTDDQRALTYLEEVNGKFRLHLLAYVNGQWSHANYGNPLDIDYSFLPEMIHSFITERYIYLVYQNGDRLHIFRYDQLSGSYYEIYQEELAHNKINDIALVEITGDPVLAYTYSVEDQQNLKIEKIQTGGFVNWQKEIKGVLGYDLTVSNGDVYLTYDRKEDNLSKIYLVEISEGNYIEKGIILRQDTTPSGLKLLNKNSELKLVYREKGISGDFYLCQTRLVNGTLTAPELLAYEVVSKDLSDLRKNIRECQDGTLILYNQDMNLLSCQGDKVVQLIDPMHTIPATVLQAGICQTYINRVELIKDLSLSKVRNLNLLNPGALVKDGSGYLYLLDKEAGKVWKIDQEGRMEDQWTLADRTAYYLADICMDSEGYLNIVDACNDRIIRMTQTGQIIETWGESGTNPGQFNHPTAIWIDSKQNIYIVDQGNARIQKFDLTHNFILSWGTRGNGRGQFNQPSSIAVDDFGRIYIADTGNHRIQAFDANGCYINEVGIWGSDAGQMIKPADLEILGDKLYVADQGNRRVQVMTLNLDYLYEFGTRGGNWGEFELLNNIYLDRDGTIYVTDGLNHTLQKISSDFHLIQGWHGGDSLEEFAALESIRRLGQTYYFFNTVSQNVLCYDSAINFLRAIKPKDVDTRILTAFTADSNYLYFTDALNHAVVIYDHQGNLVKEFGKRGNNPGEFDTPKGICLDTHHNIYVADTKNHRIQKFTQDGNLLSQWGSFGSSDGQFVNPYSINMKENKILVVDLALERVQAFEPNGNFLKKWSGLGESEDQLSMADYIQADLATTDDYLPYTFSYSFGLTNDTIPKKAKSWHWEDKFAYRYRYTINQSASGGPSGDFSNVSSASLNSGNGNYYLHIQAAQYIIFKVDESYVYHYQAVIDNTAPEISMPASVAVPQKSLSLSWSGTDNIQTNNYINYRSTLSSTPVELWTSVQWNNWNNTTFTSITSASESTGEGNRYLVVQALDRAGNSSKIQCSTYMLDNTSPTVLEPLKERIGNQLKITLKALDNRSLADKLKYRYVIDENSQTLLIGAYSAQSVYTLEYPDHDVWLHVQVIDEAGNESAQYHTQLDLFDIYPPKIIGLENHDTPVKSWTWNWSGEDNQDSANMLSYRYSLDTLPIDILTGEYGSETSVLLQNKPDGKYYLNIQAKDQAGNESEIYHYYVVLDNTVPQIDLTKILLSGTKVDGLQLFRSAVSVTILEDAYQDTSMIQQVQYSMNNTPYQNYAGQFNVEREGSNTVTIKVTDIAGNSNEATITFTIDLTAPCLSGLDANYYSQTWFKDTKLLVLTAVDAISEINSLEYKLNTSEWISLVNGGTVQVTSEGENQLQVRIEDIAGNVKTITIPVLIDRSKPVMESIQSTEHVPNRWTYLTDASFALTASDSISGIAGYYYVLDSTENLEITPDEHTFQTSTNQLELHTVQNGVNYLHILPFDKAGNVSEITTHYKFLVADETPTGPLIFSDTHIENGSSDYKKAHFIWNTPSGGNLGLVGIDYYEYSLLKEVDNVKTLVDSGTTTQSEIFFDNLNALPSLTDDYIFELVAVNAAAKHGAKTEFRFKVVENTDLTKIATRSDTHPSDFKYYKNNQLHFTWNTPEIVQDIDYFCQWSNNGTLNPDEWQSVNLCETEFVVDNTVSTTYYFWVKGEAQDQIFMSNRRIVNFDFQKPSINDFYLNLYPDQNEAVIYWGNVIDLGGSGVGSINVHLFSEDDERGWYRVNLSESEFTFKELQADQTYMVELVVADNAGNRRIRAAKFNLLTGVDYAVGKTEEFTIANWQVKGIVYDDQISNVELIIPVAYQFKVKDNDEYIFTEQLTFTHAEKVGEFISAWNDTVEYQVNLSGQIFTGQGIYLKPEGFYLQTIHLNTPESYWRNALDEIQEENKLLTFTNVKLSGLGDNKVIGTYYDEKAECVHSENWSLSIRQIVLNEKSLSLQGTVNLSAAYVASPVAFTNFILDQNLIPLSGCLSAAYDLDLPGRSKLHVIKSKIYAGYILIEDALFKFTDINGQQVVHLGNFTIDNQGLFSELDTFYSDAFSYTFGEITYTFAKNQLGFVGGLLSAKTGQAVINGTNRVLSLENVPLNNEDADMIKDAPVFMSIEKMINGIKIEGLLGYLDGDRIRFNVCNIYLPVRDELGNEIVLKASNLIYNLDDTFDLNSLQFRNAKFAYNELAEIFVNRVEVSGTVGLAFGGQVIFADHLPQGISNEYFPIHTLLITAKEGIKNLEVSVPAERPLTLYDTYQFTADRIHFKDEPEIKSIYFIGGYVNYIGVMANKLSSERAEFTITEIDNTGEIVKFDSALHNLSYDLLGLTVSMFTEYIDATTISFGGSVRLPDDLPGDLSGLELKIHNLTMNHYTGEILNFTAYIKDQRPIDIVGWNFELYGISFVNDLIKFSAGLQIPATGKIAEVVPNLAGKYININDFCLTTAGNIVSFDVKIPLDFNFDLIAGIQLEAYELGVSLTEGRLENLTLGFTRTALYLPEELGGGTLSVDNLRVNFQGQFNYDQIELTNERIPFKDVAEVYIERATLKNEGVDAGLNIKGTVTLGATFPEGLKDKSFVIKELLITSEGITRFDVGIDLTKPIQLFKAIEFSASEFSFTNSGFAITEGNIRFINDLAMTITAEPVLLHRFRISYIGEIEEFDAEFGNIDFDLLGCRVDVDSLRFTQTNISFEGSVTLPSQLPGELSSLSIAINNLVVSYQGQVEDFSIYTTKPMNFNLNGLQVSITELCIDSEGYGMIATCTLPSQAPLPEPLRGLPVTITNFRIDRNFQIVDFSISISKNVEFTVEKLRFEISSLTFTRNYFRMAGGMILPDSFPGSLKSKRINFNEFKMDYYGQILSTDISISKLDFSVGSYFTAALYDFGFEVIDGQSRLKARSLFLGVEAPINTTINFTDLSIDNNGHFSAKVQPNFTVDIPVAGVTLRLKEPNFSSTGVSVSSAELIMPETLGKKKVAVYGVTIDPNSGLQIAGGEFGLTFPNLTLGGVGIQNAYMILKLDNGKYSFEGNGKVFIPSIGEIEANLRLRTKSIDYPSGIERIYLSFQSAGPGLALGTTGLYINGLSGEFADGPVPPGSEPVVYRIGGGMRFNFNIYLRDLTGGLRGQAGFWVNINNYNSAVTGKVALLNNLIYTDVYAAICNHFSDFFAEANISILGGLVSGNSSFHVWKQGGSSYLTGAAKISIAFKRGMIYSGRFIKIPNRNRTIGSLGAEFGDFKSGVKGVKGYTSFPIVGQIGFFAGNIGFKIGGVSKYVLLDRYGTEFKLIELDSTKRTLLDNELVSLIGNFIIEDKEYVSFVLPGSQGLPRDDRFILMAKSVELKDYYVQSTERLIFAIGFEYGDPEIVAIGPDGRRYTKDSLGVEYSKEAQQILLSIPNPLPGNWHVEIANMNGLDYQVLVMGTTPKPELVFTSPIEVKENGVGNYVITGRGGAFSGKECYVDLFYDSDNQNYDGQVIAERVPLSDFIFNYEWETKGLPSGEYYIYGKLYDDGDMPPVVVYAEGSVEVNQYQPILHPARVAAVRVNNDVYVEWEQVQNTDVVGYKIHYGQESGVYTESLNVGLINGINLSLPEDQNYYLAITAYNAMLEESNYSLEIAIGVSTGETQVLNLSEAQVPENIHLYIGEGKEISIPYNAVGIPSGDAGDYFTASFEDLPAGVYAQFDKPIYHLYALEQEISTRILTEIQDIKISEGDKKPLLLKAEPVDGTVTMVFTSCGNPDLQIRKVISLVCEYHKPELYEVAPKEGINNIVREITITGDNFREGTAVYLDRTLLEIVSLDKNIIVAKVPAGFAPGYYDVSVVNADSQSVAMKESYQVFKPTFMLKSMQKRLMISRGATGTICLTAEGYNEFAGVISVQPSNVPTGFWLNPEAQSLTTDSEIVFEISAGYELTPGEYVLNFTGLWNGEVKDCEIIIEVVEGNLKPAIESFNKPFAITMEPFIIYGQGFGYTGNLILNGQLLPVIQWGPNRIECNIPKDAVSGSLTVKAGGRLSEPVQLIIKEKKYSVTVNPTKILLNCGKEMEISFAITGFSDPIDFSLKGLPKQMSYEFLNNASGVIPNSMLICKLTTTEQIDLGEYQLNLVGQTGEAVNEYPFIIAVADLPEVQNFELAEGRVDVLYKEQIRVHGGFTPYQYEIIQNSLPAGLSLSGDGRISGLPKAAGIYHVHVRVTDAAGSVRDSELKLNILTNEWIYSDYDEGKRNSCSGAGPAIDEEEYAVDVTEGYSVDMMLSSEEMVIMFKDNQVGLYAKENGSKQKQITLTSNAQDAVVLRESLLILTENGELTNYHYGTDSMTSLETGLNVVGDMLLYQDQVLIVSNERLQFRRKDNLRLHKDIVLPYQRNVQIRGIVKDNLYCYIDTYNRVIGFDLAKGIAHFAVVMNEEVIDLIADFEGLLVITANGVVNKLSTVDGSVSFVLDYKKPIMHLVPYKIPLVGYAVSDGSKFELYGINGKPYAMIDGDFHQAIVARNRIYTAGENGITAYKLSNLHEVWTSTVGKGTNLILGNGALYALAGGKLHKYNGPANVYAPKTTLITKPAEPDGQNGYFRQCVTVYLDANDRDNEVGVTYYSLNNSEFTEYKKLINLDEGIHSLKYYSIDETSKMEDVKSATIKVDYTAPEIQLIKEPVDGNNGYYKSASVTFLLSAEDQVSGVDSIYYRIDGGEYQLYVDAIIISGDGAHQIEYYAIDRAGNVTEVFTDNLKIDSEAPVSTVTRIKPVVNGLQVNIRFAATDNYSQFATLYYQIDASEYVSTQQDIYLTEPGEYTITYYAEDMAGNIEQVKQVTCYVKSLAEINFIDNVEFTEFHNGQTQNQPWEIDQEIENGDRIYLDEDKYLFETLPDYLTEARYLRTNRHANSIGSNDYYLEFRATVNLKVYVVVEASVTEIPEFTLIGQAKLAHKMQFSQLQNVFMQQVSGNSTIRIPSKEFMDVGFAPLVFYTYDQERLPFACFEEITLHKRDNQWFLDFTAYGYDYMEGMIEGEKLEWNCRFDGVEVLKGYGESGTIPIEFRSEPYLLELTLLVTNSVGVQGTSRICYVITDQSGLFIEQPIDKAKYCLGELITLHGGKRDELGNIIPSTLIWEWRHDSVSDWQYLGIGETLTVLAPDQKGSYDLRLRDDAEVVSVKLIIQGNDNSNGNKKNGK